MRFEWDPAKEAVNRQKHGLSFGDVTDLFTSGVDSLELPDTAHDGEEERLIAIGPVVRGLVMAVFSERHEDGITYHQRPTRDLG